METLKLFSWCSLERPSDARAWTQAGFLAPMAAMRPRWRDLFPAAYCPWGALSALCRQSCLNTMCSSLLRPGPASSMRIR